MCAAIIDEIELNIAPASNQLKLAFAVSIGFVSAPLGDWKICRKKRSSDALNEFKNGLDSGIGILAVVVGCERFVRVLARQIVKEYPADATRLISVLDEEILVAPFLESRVIPRVELIARIL